MDKSKFKIIDTTLRDGSYAINFQFSKEQTSIISNKLEDAGIEYIEVGHGVGLNACASNENHALCTDEEYIVSAVNSVKNAKIGVFCIPKFARLDDINMAADRGLKFIRVGTNATEVKTSQKYIERAKKLGLEVFANYMKSYALSPKEFAKNVKLSESYGADGVYIVDSAGGMFKEDIKKYFDEIRKVSTISVGFHAHDNLGLAIANNIASIEMGLNFIDTSLQGLGRSSGNASTELVVLSMIKKGYSLDIDYIKLMEIGAKYIIPLLSAKGRTPLDMISGFAEFHTSYMKFIKECSLKHNVNPLELIIEYCKYDKINMDVKKLDELGCKIKNRCIPEDYNYERYYGNEQYIG